MKPIISADDVSALIGRPLTNLETANFETYLKIAIERLEGLLCITLTCPLKPGLKLLLANCFDAIGKEQKANRNRGVKSKKVEDFDITYEEMKETPMEAFVNQNERDLERYSECQAPIRQGKVCNGDGIRLLYLD